MQRNLISNRKLKRVENEKVEFHRAPFFVGFAFIY